MVLVDVKLKEVVEATHVDAVVVVIVVVGQLMDGQLDWLIVVVIGVQEIVLDIQEMVVGTEIVIDTETVVGIQ